MTRPARASVNQRLPVPSSPVLRTVNSLPAPGPIDVAPARPPGDSEANPAGDACAASSSIEAAIARAMDHLAAIQRPDGSVAGETTWCIMITAQVVITSAVTGLPLAPERREAIQRYLEHQQNEDGGFPLYEGGPSTLFLTTLGHVALRLLGCGPDHSACVRTLRWLSGHNVATIPTWGKAWLAVAGLYEWDGLHPIPPEMWLLPKAAPVHPRRFYCHTRLIYLGFSYLYGVRFVGRLPGGLRDALRAELYGGRYDTVDFRLYRSEVAATDRYVPKDPALEGSYALLGAIEPRVSRSLRGRALAEALRRIRVEHRNSQFLGISPVNGLLFSVALCHGRGPNDEETQSSWAGVDHWAVEDGGGRRYAGAASNSWDTAFAAQALLTLPEPLGRRAAPVLARMHAYFQENQVDVELAELESTDRVPIRFGWCFGEGKHRWPVSDCTAEALSALTLMEHHGRVPGRFDAERLAGAVSFVLARQNADGGFSSYEPARGGRLLEHVNPSELFGSCMGEYSYLECTSSCVQGLAHVLGTHGAALPAELARDASRAIARGADYLSRCARPDGSFEAVWGVNFTYGAWFAVTGLRAAGRPSHDPVVRRAVEWLLAHQLEDGGWGEALSSAWTHEYTPTRESQVIMTAWAVLALVASGRRAEVADAVERGVQLLLARQRQDGTWPREEIAGVFFDTAGLHYELYRQVFPFWALAAASRG